MIPNPIRKVLSTLSTHEVRYLLMGGQACVLYGAAEFSRDCDVAILCEPQNLARLQQALDELHAEPITVPPFNEEYLRHGHAVHFRCHAPEAEQESEREANRDYWTPLKRELEQLRHHR